MGFLGGVANAGTSAFYEGLLCNLVAPILSVNSRFNISPFPLDIGKVALCDWKRLTSTDCQPVPKRFKVEDGGGPATFDYCTTKKNCVLCRNSTANRYGSAETLLTQRNFDQMVIRDSDVDRKGATQWCQHMIESCLNCHSFTFASWSIFAIWGPWWPVCYHVCSLGQ